jgi:dTDP-glucose 4,6-dehydratase
VKTVLVTGGSGFIGGWFIRQLLDARFFKVVNVDKMTYASALNGLRPPANHGTYTAFRVDICDFDVMGGIVRATRPDIIVNFAAESHVQRSIDGPAEFVRSNTEGVRVLLDIARSSRIERFIQVSTDEVYGDRKNLDSASEEDRLWPSSPYSASKASADLLCLAYKRTYGVPVVITRSCNNYGPFQYPEKLIPVFIMAALQGQPLKVHGDGTHVREWVYVEDNCRAILRVMEEGQIGEIYNIGGEPLQTHEVQSLIFSILERTQKISRLYRKSKVEMIADRLGNDHTYSVSYDKIRRELSWRPTTAFAVGLKRTIKWYWENLKAINRCLGS